MTSTSSQESTSKRRASWTPEQWIQGFKELVTAILGLTIVLFTLVLANSTFLAAGEAKISDAKDVLLMVQGLAGVVIGYYFGRVPADARTTQAQVQATEATAQAAYISAKTQSAADQIEQLITRTATPDYDATRSGPPALDSGMNDDLQRIRDQLREIARLAL